MTEIDDYIKFSLYFIISELPFVTAFSLAYGKGLEHAATLWISISLNFFTVPAAILTDFFSGLTSLEWFAIGIMWVGHLSIANKVLD